MQQNLLRLAELIERIQHVDLHSPGYLKTMQSSLKAEITKHKEYFSKRGYNNVILFLESGQYNAAKMQDYVLRLDAKELFTAYLHTLTTLTDEYHSFVQDEFNDAINKLYALCGDDNNPPQSISNVKNLLRKYADGKAARPIFKLCEFFELPSNDFSKPIWYKLISTHNKKALKFLAKADEIEKLLGQEFNDKTSYEKILETWFKLLYPKYSDVIKAQTTAVSRTHLRDFTALCGFAGVCQEDYNNIINLLPNIKTEDELPNIQIDGKDLDGDFGKYYMLKLSHNDLRGFILGELTGCCQNVYNEYSQEIVMSCMTDPNYGIYVILQKDKKGAANINNFSNKIVAHSIAWLGDETRDGGKTLVFDSWERTGVHRNKLLYPFYSKFAEEAASKHNFKKVYIGMTINSPPTIYIPYKIALEDARIQRSGKIPNNDSETQLIILDKELNCYPYDKEIKEKYDSLTKPFEQILREATKEGFNKKVAKLLGEFLDGIDKAIIEVVAYDILRISAESDAAKLSSMILDCIDSIKLKGDILANAVEEDHKKLAHYMINNVPLRSQVFALHIAVFNENEELASSMLSTIQKAGDSTVYRLLSFAAEEEWYYNTALFIMKSQFGKALTEAEKLDFWSYIHEDYERKLLEVQEVQQLEALAEVLKSQMRDISEETKDALLLYATESAILKEALNLLNMKPDDISNETALKMQEILLNNSGSISFILDDSDILNTSVLERTMGLDETREIIAQALAKHPDSDRRVFGNKDFAPIPEIPAAFASYYQDQVALLLKLRLEDTAPGVLKSVNILEENYTLRESNADNIAEILSSFIIASNKNTILMPLNIGGSHLVAIAAVKDGSNVVIHYMDSELGIPPQALFTKIGSMLESNDYSMELRIAGVERQKYSNCGPEVIENLSAFASKKPRASQEEAILKHSLALERQLLKDSADSSQPDLSASVAIFSGASALNEKLVAQVRHYLNTGELFDSARSAIEDGTVSIILRQSAVVSDEEVPNTIPLIPIQTYNADSYHDNLEALSPTTDFSQDYTVAIVGLLCSFLVST